MPPYLTLTTAKVKIKLPSYFFPNSHGWDRKFHFEKVSNKLHCYLSVKLTECFPAKPSGSSGKLMRLLQDGSSWNFINQFWHAKYFTTYCIFFEAWSLSSLVAINDMTRFVFLFHLVVCSFDSFVKVSFWRPEWIEHLFLNFMIFLFSPWTVVI